MLQAAALTPAAAAVGAAVPASAAATPEEQARTAASFDAVDPRFTLAVVPDTQYLFDAVSIDPEPLTATFRYLVRERRERNVAFVAHLGDVVEHGGADEIEPAARVFRSLGALPHSVIAGNHDINGSTDDQRGDTPYLRAFGPSYQRRMKTYRSSSPGGYNTAHVFSGGGREWLQLALDWRMSDLGLSWAQGVLDAHPKLPAIVTIHEFAAPDGDGGAAPSGYGQTIWDRLIRRNDQIFLVLSGHFWPSGTTVLTNDAGHDVHAHILNYQDRYYGGAGMVRTYAFDLVRGAIDVETFSPWLIEQRADRRSQLGAEHVEMSGPADRFSLEIDFDERFAGFAPVPVPAPRPARAVMPTGTVAYWRFDGEGIGTPGPDGTTVGSGTVARDLTGNGNDLAVVPIQNSPAEVLKFSTEHHPVQPAHASLRFDGGQPARGATLRTGDRAPINSLKFERGYTIETFLKLPEPFVGNHGFMGVFSWEGRAADAGKTGGYSPDECTCSLNVSGERFLQYVVYPVRTDDDPTAWSHAIPTGRWTHVAIVNDGRRSSMYVDGSLIVRNPDLPSTGIATLGRPFVLGATSSGLRYGQGFYGWLGDTRIVGRALRPEEFLAPARRR
ncbi:metallophosphoesterase [Kribbella italica]|nr:LamG-like jellyroll fold domain-containing protein [Kribbella italica]